METESRPEPPNAPAVLHVVHSLVRAGTESQCARIAMSCAARGLTHRVAVSVRAGDFLAPVESACGPVHEMGTGRMLSRRTVERVQELRRFIRDHRIDLVHAWDADAVLFGSWAARAERVPIITSLRDLGEIYGPWKLRLMLRAHRRAAAVVVNAEAIRRFLTNHRVSEQAIRVLPNAVDLQEFAMPAAPDALPEGIRVISVARLDRVKDLGCVIRAAHLLSADRPDIQWLLVGDGSERARLETLARGAPVHFLGHRADVPGLLRQAHIGILTSRASEGLSNAILEYFAASLPVIATALGGNPELVRDGATGYLIPVGDPAALAERVLALGAAPDQRATLGAAGRRFVEEHCSLPAVTDRFLDLYRSIHECYPWTGNIPGLLHHRPRPEVAVQCASGRTQSGRCKSVSGMRSPA